LLFSVDITFTPVVETEHQAFYWEVNFLYSDDTKPCITNMLEEYATMLADESFVNDHRWDIWFTVAGFKSLLYQSLKGLAFNYFQLDFTWVVPSLSNKDDAFAEASAIYEQLLAAYRNGDSSSCITLDEYFEDLGPYETLLKAKFGSTYATATDDKSLSQLQLDVALFDFDALGLEDNGVPFKSSYQQGPQFPTSSGIVDIFNSIDALVPTNPLTDHRLVISQIVTLPGPAHSNNAVAQPFQNDLMGVTFDVWNFLPAKDYSQDQRETQDVVISALGGIDHRMFWAAYEDTCLECGAWENYYESRPEYNKLTQTKRCVDPNNLFKFRMSMPTNPLNENLF
jgi:hypothetical protein